MSRRRLPTLTRLTRPEIWAVVAANRGLCGTISAQFLGRGLERDDLIQEGLFGLYRAVELFDAGRVNRDGTPIRFSTYAARWIKQAMRAATVATGSTVRLPGYVRDRAARAVVDATTLDGLRENARICVQAAMHTLPPTDRQPGLVAGCAGPDRTREAERDARVGAAVDALPARERAVLVGHYGLEGTPRTQQDIGSAMGLTRMVVRRIEREAMGHLRILLEA